MQVCLQAMVLTDFILISSTEFAKWHLKRVKEGYNINQCNRVLLPCLPAAQSFDFEAASVAGDYQATSTLNYPNAILLHPNRAYVEILGLCNGLVCLSDENRSVVLWNPSTGAWRVLPKHSVCRNNDVMPKHSILLFDALFFGLGYDESVDDYKLVVGITDYADPSRFVPKSVQIFTLKSNKWRKVKNVEDAILLNTGIYVDHHIHWIAQRRLFKRTERDYEIVSFNIKEERFEDVVPFPDIGDREIYLVTLGLWRTRLCLFCECEDNHFEIWVLQGHATDATWENIVVAYSYFDDHNATPLCLTDNNEVVCDYESSIGFYDPLRGLSFFERRPSRVCCDAGVYLETLVSPYY